MKVKDFKNCLRKDIELPKELVWFLANRKDEDELDLLNRADYFATKLWSEGDIQMVYEQITGSEPEPEDVAEILNRGGRWPYLHDCTDGEWDCIFEEVELYLKERSHGE